MTTNKPAEDILISGASIAGPSLAYWLRRFGFNPTIVERAPSLRGGGYAVDFRGTAQLTVLERMGILDELREHGTEEGEILYVDERGNRLAAMPAYLFAGDVEVLRGELARVFYDRTRSGTEYLFGDSIAELSQDADGVDVTFENGGARRFDLVIGADGVHSNTRRLAFGPEADYLRYNGFYTAIFTTRDSIDVAGAGVFHSVPGKAAGVYRGDDEGGIAMMMFASSGPIRYDYRDLVQQRRIVTEQFADVGWHVPELLADMARADDFYFDSASQIHLPGWSNGRVALLGDAGYAGGPGAGGTGLAAVGAYILAGELARSADDHEQAFASYENKMREYVRINQKQGEGGAGFLVPDSRRKIWFRNQMYRTLPYMPWRGVVKKMASKAANAIDLPTY